MKNKKKLLVVGGTGFLGFHLCKKALKKKWSVTSISSNRPKKLRFLKKVNYLVFDISKKNNFSKIKSKFDYIVNFGGYVDHKNKIKTYKSHYIGCKNLADYFLNKDIKSFIQIGSCVEYGNKSSPQDEKSSIDTKKLKSFYGKSKLMASNYLLKLFKKKGFPITILRLYFVYGPYQDINRFIPIIIDGCLKNLKFDTSDWKQLRDFLYVDDLIYLIFKVFENKNSKGEIFNIGSGKPQSIKKIINLIRNKIKRGRPNFGKINLRNDEILKIYHDISKAKKILNWRQNISFRIGLNKTIKFYKTRFLNKKWNLW